MNDSLNDKIDAIILCGEGKASKSVHHKIKTMLPIEGKPIFHYVAESISRVDRVKRIFIVGHKDEIDLSIKELGPLGDKPIVVVEQFENLVTNIWQTFLKTLDSYSVGAELNDESIRNKVVLVTGGDSPLLATKEVDQFIDGANMDESDYYAGLTPDTALDRFADKEGKEGVKMAYFHVAEGLYRINNLHLARPFAFKNRVAIQQLYNSRYQKNLRNMVRFFRDLWAIKGIRSRTGLYFLLVTAMTARNVGLTRIADSMRRRTKIDDVFGVVSDILGLRASYSITNYGGAALDIDNDHDYEVIKERFDDWRKLAREEASK